MPVEGVTPGRWITVQVAPRYFTVVVPSAFQPSMRMVSPTSMFTLRSARAEGSPGRFFLWLCLVHHILGQKGCSSKARQGYSLHFAPISFFGRAGHGCTEAAHEVSLSHHHHR